MSVGSKRGGNNATVDLSSFSKEDQALYHKIASCVQNYKVTVRSDKLFNEEEIEMICTRVGQIFLSEPVLVPVEAPVNICGDIHGQLHDLVSIFNHGGLPSHSRYLFLGDYVDRGKYGIEVLCILFGFKILFPGNIFLLRGNHESAALTRQYGFFDECKRKYSVGVYKKFLDVFARLPLAGLVEHAALCMHGGLSPELKQLSSIEQIARPCEIGEAGLAVDLLWSDPSKDIEKWGTSDRGVSYIFGAKVVEEQLAALDIDLVVRAHQVMEKGYEFFAGRKLVTVFSATNYCGEFTNSGAMLMMDRNLQCKFHLFEPLFIALATDEQVGSRQA